MRFLALVASILAVLFCTAVPVGAQTPYQTPIVDGVVFYGVSSAPAAVAGKLYYNSTSNEFFAYNGTNWGQLARLNDANSWTASQTITSNLSVIGGSLINLWTGNVPTSGEYISAGFNLELCFTGVVCQPSNFLLYGQVAIYATTLQDAVPAEYNVSIYTNVATGANPYWQTGVSYANGTEVNNGTSVYINNGATNTAGVTMPTCLSGTCSDGSITWTYINSINAAQGKVGLWVPTYVTQGGGQTWGAAFDMILNVYWYSMFMANVEFDIQYQSATACAPAACTVFNVYIGGAVGANPISAYMAFGITNNGSVWGGYYGILMGPGTYMFQNAAIEIDSSSALGISLGAVAATTFSTAAVQDQSTTPIGLYLNGTYSSYSIAAPNFALNPSGEPYFMITVAPPTNGSASDCILVSSTANLGFCWGAGAPTFSAAKGTIYLNTTATTTTTRLYINTNGSTTWTYFTSNA